MKKDYTHLCIVLDASGSMESIANDIKGSFNALLVFIHAACDWVKMLEDYL